MIRKVVGLVVFVPLGVLLIVLAVANRAPVRLALNPFDPADQALSASAPLFVLLILAVMLGVLLGAIVTWFTQGKHRKKARSQSRVAQQWQAEADRQKTRAEEIAGATLPQLGAK
ncbi:LapA family protein [Rhizobium rhizophilum]|uniref:LapA family protein n=1 Tax=Rhizobium rhizophilum TaxID=1850373 RepID=A0ABY2R253_9HYPH|nr:LapA family protein [Rhizobium rhizophilum]THV17254.1 LapA family protein [Rhizobium rhizophilum]